MQKNLLAIHPPRQCLHDVLPNRSSSIAAPWRPWATPNSAELYCLHNPDLLLPLSRANQSLPQKIPTKDPDHNRTHPGSICYRYPPRVPFHPILVHLYLPLRKLHAPSSLPTEAEIICVLLHKYVAYSYLVHYVGEWWQGVGIGRNILFHLDRPCDLLIEKHMV
jgi:hypothetical protein